MKFDWITFLAQIGNFLILLWILKRFLYQPITEAMENRRQRVQSRIEEAEKQKNEAEQEKERYETLQKEFEQKREEKIEQAEREAKEKKEELLTNAREEVDRKKKEWVKQFKNQKKVIQNELRSELANVVYRATSRLTEDLANQELNRAIVGRFIERMKTLSSEGDRSTNLNELPEDAVATVVSSDPLSVEDKDRLKEAVSSYLSPVERVEFETDDELLCGIRVDVASWSLEWNGRDYIRRMEREFSDSFEDHRLISRMEQIDEEKIDESG